MSPVEHPRFRDGALPWVYYWLDLYGPDGTPANSKVLVSWGFFTALAAALWWGVQLSTPRCFPDPDGIVTCHYPTGIQWPYVALVGLILALAMGKDVFKAAIKSKLTIGGGDDQPDAPLGGAG